MHISKRKAKHCIDKSMKITQDPSRLFHVTLNKFEPLVMYPKQQPNKPTHIPTKIHAQ